MKKTIVTLLALVGLGVAVQAQAPVPTYQWNFNLTNSTSGTNLVYSTVPGGNVQGPAAPTDEGIVQMQNSSAAPVNLLGLPGSGVGTNAVDRAVLLAGSMGGSGPIIRTPALANTLTNLGILTNFTVTAWIKADSAFSGFPRILMFGQQNLDTGNGVNNVTFLQFNPGDTLQLKVNGLGANGINGPTGLLTAGAADWLFVAVTYDSTIDPTVTSNVYFYSGDRFNSLGAGSGATYGTPNGAGTSINSVFPASINGPGYVNFSGDTNGDGSFSAVSNQVWVYIGNRNGNARSFNGRYDDVRLYANKVLSQSELDQVRLSPGLQLPGPLQISQQPQNVTVAEGQGAGFSVTHSVAPNVTYQWYRINPASSTSNAIAGATSRNYTTPALTVASDSGAKYAVRITSTDPAAGTIYSQYGTVTVLSTSLYTVTPGVLKFEYFADNTGSTVDGFLTTPSSNYPFAPNLTAYLPTFDTRNAFPDDSHNNYFVRISGTITPTVSTNYVFYLCAADQAQLYLSTDGGASSNLIAIDTQNGPQVFTGPESPTSIPGGQFSAPVALVAGSNYPVYAFLKSSVGPDFLQVAWRTDSGSQDLPINDANLADRLQPIPTAVLSTPALPQGTLSITSQPGNASVPAHAKVTFSVGVSATGSGPVTVQWQKNGVNVAGATGTSYTTPYVSTADNGAQFNAVVSIPGVASNSTPATLTVTADNANPMVISATPDDSMRSVTILFSEPVDVTALSAGNYSIPGLTVLGAAYAADTNLVDNPVYDAIKLSTSLQADNTAYTVIVSNVKDTAGNTISVGNTASFRSYGFLPGFAKFEYFENQTYSSIIGLDVNALVSSSPKFTNNDPDTVVYPTSLEMSPDGSPTIRSSSGGNLNAFPPFYGTRMSTLFTPGETTNYVFYIAANDSGILWLSTDGNPANKHAIAWQDVPAQKRNWNASLNASTATFGTNLVGTGITVPGATPWPVADVNGFAVITLQAGTRYYLELDQLENAGFDSFDAVTWVTAADNATVVPPGNGSSPATGTVIGWHFPQPRITSFAQSGNNVVIGWTNGLGGLNLGALGYPGLGSITASFPSPTLQSAVAVAGPYTSLTNTSPATFPATGPAQFFRIGE